MSARCLISRCHVEVGPADHRTRKSQTTTVFYQESTKQRRLGVRRRGSTGLSVTCAHVLTTTTPMEFSKVLKVDNVLLTRRGHRLRGLLVLLRFHMVFTFPNGGRNREIWICYPIIGRVKKSRGCSWSDDSRNGSRNGAGTSDPELSQDLAGFDRYLTSNLCVTCKDFTYYLFDFTSDAVCTDVYVNLSRLATVAKTKGIGEFYAFEYRPNALELKVGGWHLYDLHAEYQRQGLLEQPWRLSRLNSGYRFCPSYPESFVIPAAISDSVLQHAGKFRSKQRVPAIVYRHRQGPNGNIIARCLQPLVGLNLQNRSMQDERLVEAIFRSQQLSNPSTEQPQRNLIVDLRPITNAMAQHALGAGTENVDNYRGKHDDGPDQQVDKIFCNIDNIHVMRDSLNKLTAILADLDKSENQNLQQALTKTQWLHRLLIILQSVDRISKSVHLNNTNVLIHCSDGWDRTSQISALAQLCLDPYFRTMRGFMVLVEKEWLSFGFKFATRGDNGGCMGALLSSEQKDGDSETPANALQGLQSSGTKVASFLQRAANHIKNASNSESESLSVYSGSNERSPIFHQFLDCVYQIYRQRPGQFEFNSRFLKRLFYHSYSCQYGTFLCNSEKSLREENLANETVSVWDYFLSRPAEFLNHSYDAKSNTDVVFFNYSEIKWWYELYGRTDSEMNGLSNSLDKKFSELGKTLSPGQEKTPE